MEVFKLVPLPLHNMSYLLNQQESLLKTEIPKKISDRNRIVSKGTLNVWKGKNLDKLVQLTVKGLHMYYYDFGIAYPSKSIAYPIFFYQIISAPKRVLVVVHYAFYNKENIEGSHRFEELLRLDTEYSDMLIKSFEPQNFIMEDIIPNAFNGLVRTTEIDKAHERISELFKKWHEGLESAPNSTEEELVAYHQWLSSFKQKFYKEDYGYTASKRFLGEKWAKEVFEDYLFS